MQEWLLQEGVTFAIINSQQEISNVLPRQIVI